MLDFGDILRERLAAAQERRPELADVHWLSDDEILQIGPRERAFITAYVAYAYARQRPDGRYPYCQLKIGLTRTPIHERVDALLESFADALLSGTAPTIAPGETLP